MRLFSGLLALAIVAAASPSYVRGSIQLISANPIGSATIVHDGEVRFQNLRTGFDFTAPDIIVAKEFEDGVSDIVLDFTYLAGDLHGAGILRLSEIITNSSGSVWTDFTVTLTGPGTFFTDYPGGTFFAPTFASINLGALPDVISDDEPNPGTMDSFGTVSPTTLGSKTLTFTFDEPLEPGDTFGIHIPLADLPVAGTFQLVQSATAAVPEATSLVVWSLLSFVWCCAATKRRRGELL